MLNRSFHIANSIYRAVLGIAVLGSFVVLPACASGPEGGSAGQEEETATTEQAVITGWTPYTSEEYAPIQCDNSSLVTDFQCTGSKCDNVRMYCTPTAGTPADSYQTGYFSEEGTSWKYCDAGYWATGLDCRGSNCDDVSLRCTRMTNLTARDCAWTGWVSEEHGGYLSFGGKYARGAQCSGSNCDNMRFYVCSY